METRRVKLSFQVRRPILACGADLKGAFALAKGGQVLLYEGFGDLGDLDNFERYEEAIAGAIKNTGIKPAIVAHDMHPGYFSSRFAHGFAKTAYLYAVQHHEAHVASCIIDNDIKGSVIGVAFDGTGYGLDGKIWGGEFFVGGLKNLKRAAHLEYVHMPGGEAAVRQPWRMAESYIYASSGKCKDPLIMKMIKGKINSPLTSSAGRLFDAAASLILERKKADFEAELPILLERLIAEDVGGVYRYVVREGSPFDISSGFVIKGILDDIRKGVDKAVISARFHNTVSDMIVRAVEDLGRKSRLNKVVLSGGVFQNNYLVGRVIENMDRSGFKLYRHRMLSTTDSGIPVGQIAIVHARYAVK